MPKVVRFNSPRIWVVVAGSKATRVFVRTSASLRQLIGPQPAVKENAAEITPARLARWLQRAEEENAYDRLIIVAARPTLRHIRRALSARVYLRVAAEIAAEMSQLPPETLVDHVSDIFLETESRCGA